MMLTLRKASRWALLAVLAPACQPAEHRLLDQYFRAVSSGEEHVASALSVASFPGEPDSWEIVEIGPETTVDFRMFALRKEARAARSAFDQEVEKNDEFLNANADLYRQYRERIDKDPDSTFRGRLAEFQKEWEARLEKQKELESEARRIESAYEREREAARRSINVTVGDGFEGDVTEKKVDVRVGGGAGGGMYSITLRRYNLVDRERNLTPMAKWVIYDIVEESAGSATAAQEETTR